MIIYYLLLLIWGEVFRIQNSDTDLTGLILATAPRARKDSERISFTAALSARKSAEAAERKK